MTDRSKLLALAEAVEKLTGPDREVDGRIAWANGLFDRFSMGDETTVSYYSFLHNYDRAEVHVIGQKGGRIIYTCEVPAYTASLDAAMTLVPDGWRMWTADFSIAGRFVWMLCGPKSKWIEHEDGSKEGGTDWYQSGVSCAPAPALCAAALRAQAEALS